MALDWNLKKEWIRIMVFFREKSSHFTIKKCKIQPSYTGISFTVMMSGGIMYGNYNLYLHNMDIEKIIAAGVEERASDIHLSPGLPVHFRVMGSMKAYEEENLIQGDEIQAMLLDNFGEREKTMLQEDRQVDFLYISQTGVRLRGNAFFQQYGVAVSFRIIPSKIRPLDTLGFPDFLKETLMNKKQGLVLVVGPTGEGKSTTLASILQERASLKKEHIITIEDPVEYLLPSGNSVFQQREVGRDVNSFTDGITAALREDPDTVMVGELRNLNTIKSALTMAETGHLVFGTLHTNDGPQTVSRIIDVFPGDEQDQIRAQLASSLSMVLSQRLLPRADGSDMVLAYEVLTNNYAVANYIRQNKIFQIPNVLQTDSSGEMIQMEQSLAGLVINGDVTIKTALEFSMSPDNLKSILSANGYSA